MKELQGEDFNHEIKVARDAMEAEKRRQIQAEAAKLSGIGVSVNRNLPPKTPSYAEEQLAAAMDHQSEFEKRKRREACEKLVKEVNADRTYEMEWRLDPKYKITEPATDPAHYHLAIEPIDYILKNKLSYLEGNIIKYVSRWRQKGGAEDLRKAQVYLGWLIEEAESE